EHPAMLGEGIIARRHAEPGGHVALMGIGDLELMIAEDEMQRVAELLRDRQGRGEALPVAIDEIAEMDDKGELAPVEIGDRGGELAGRGVIEALAAVRLVSELAI